MKSRDAFYHLVIIQKYPFFQGTCHSQTKGFSPWFGNFRIWKFRKSFHCNRLQPLVWESRNFASCLKSKEFQSESSDAFYHLVIIQEYPFYQGSSHFQTNGFSPWFGNQGILSQIDFEEGFFHALSTFFNLHNFPNTLKF